MPEQDEKQHPLKRMLDKVAGSETAQQSSFPVALVITGFAILGFAIMGFLLMRAKRKAARLAFKLRRKEEEQVKAREDIELAENEETRAVAQKKIEEIEFDILVIKTDMRGLKIVNEHRRKVIADLASWDDFVVVDKRDEQ